jgi:hypothetical protein
MGLAPPRARPVRLHASFQLGVSFLMDVGGSGVRHCQLVIFTSAVGRMEAGRLDGPLALQSWAYVGHLLVE